MDKFALNLYKAFGIYKRSDESYSISFDGEDHPLDQISKDTPREAMKHILDEINNDPSRSAQIHFDGGTIGVGIDPETGRMTLSHIDHARVDSEIFDQMYIQNWANHAAEQGMIFNPEGKSWRDAYKWGQLNSPHGTFRERDDSFAQQALQRRDQNAWRRMRNLARTQGLKGNIDVSSNNLFDDFPAILPGES